MYQVISSVNSIIREEIIPNPFEYIIDNTIVAMLFFYLFGAKVLYKIAFNMCGIFYNSGDNPILGSIGYMFFYCINIGVFLILSILFNNFILTLVMYIVFVIVMFMILHKIKWSINDRVI